MARLLVLFALILLAFDARGEDRALTVECPPRAVLEAARNALAAGDREGAVRHMRRANEILAACQRRLPKSEPVDEAPPERALAQRGAQLDTPATDAEAHPTRLSVLSDGRSTDRDLSDDPVDL